MKQKLLIFPIILCTFLFFSCDSEKKETAQEESTALKQEIKTIKIPDNAVTTESGLQYVDIKIGEGETPQKGQIVETHYTGWLLNGNKFDSSLDRNEPLKFELGVGRVIPGWDEGISTMRVGGKRKLFVPSHLGYGERGYPPVIPPNATLVFEVELLGVE